MATQETPRRKLVNMTAFFVFAFIEQSLFVVIGISAAEDILTQTNVPTSVVLVSITGPYFLVTLLVPPFVHSIPLSTVVLVESCFFVISLLLVAVTQNLVSRLIGVSLSPVHVAWEIFLFSLGHLVMKRILSGHSRPALELGFGCLRCITWVCY